MESETLPLHFVKKVLIFQEPTCTEASGLFVLFIKLCEYLLCWVYDMAQEKICLALFKEL